MLSNQTSRVYCDIDDMEYLADMLVDAAEAHRGDTSTNFSDMCIGAAYAVHVLAHNRLDTAADFMAVWTGLTTGRSQKAKWWQD